MTPHPSTSIAPLPVATGQAVKTDLEAAAWLFEQLAVQAGQPADRPRIRRALEEAAATWPPGQEDRWWKWLVEASRSLGLQCQIIDCTFDQLAEMAREGARVVTRIGAERQWTAISATRGHRFHVLRPLRDQNQLWVRTRRLKNLFGVHGQDEVTRCLVLDPGLAGGDVGPSTASDRTPLRRLWALLKPESGDIWIIMVFALVIGMLALATPLAVETLVNTVAFGRLLQPVVVLALMLLAFLSFLAAVRALQTYVVEIIQQRLFARVAADLAYRLPRTEIEALDGKVGRELVNRFFDVVTVQKVCAQLLLDGITLVLGALIGMAVLSFYHPWLLGFAVVLLSMLAFAIFVLGRGAISTSAKESKRKYMMAAWLEELVSCPITFRHCGAAEFALDRADRLTYEYLSARKAHFRVLMRQIVFVLALQAVASTVLLGLGGWLVISGQLTLGQLVAAELIVTAIVGSFAKLGKHMESFYDLLAAVDKLGVLFDLPIERQDGLLTLPNGRPAAVRISNATYTNPAGSLKLSNLQLQIASGERVVLTGASGSGKSQLLDLLYGNRTPHAGHVAINGLDPRDLRPDALRRYVALVRHQEIFSGTVAENVHLERPDVSTNDVRDALQQVGLLERVLGLPEGLETPLVESGYPLTTSQARKLMLARAIAGRPRLLLIDELLDCFSDQDAAFLMDVLCEPTRPWTLVVVSGRSAIIQKAARVIEMGQLTDALRQEPVYAG